MFHIRLSPQVSSLTTPEVTVSGDVLTVNGEAFDFSQLNEGDVLSSDAVDSPYIDGVPLPVGGGSGSGIYRKDGDVYLAIICPLVYGSPMSACFPAPEVVSISSGGLEIPDATPVKTQAQVTETSEQQSETATTESEAQSNEQ